MTGEDGRPRVACVDCTHYAGDARCVHPDSESFDVVNGIDWKFARERRSRDNDTCGPYGYQFEPTKPNSGGCFWVLIVIAIIVVIVAGGMTVTG